MSENPGELRLARGAGDGEGDVVSDEGEVEVSLLLHESSPSGVILPAGIAGAEQCPTPHTRSFAAAVYLVRQASLNSSQGTSASLSCGRVQQ
jgi:hypothetical protein